LIRKFESMPDGPVFLAGDEESYGFLVETEVRDKDAVSAAMMACELALYHLSKGKSVLERLYELYKKHGFFREILVTREFKGESGLKTMNGLMDGLRSNPPARFAGENVERVMDYKDGTTRMMATGKMTKDIDLPSSNVLQFALGDGSMVSVRPSGTEPKIKFYVSARSAAGMDAARAEAAVDAKLKLVGEEIERLIASMAG
jgi:phosphoglucomutase